MNYNNAKIFLLLKLRKTIYQQKAKILILMPVIIGKNTYLMSYKYLDSILNIYIGTLVITL